MDDLGVPPFQETPIQIEALNGEWMLTAYQLHEPWNEKQQKIAPENFWN